MEDGLKRISIALALAIAIFSCLTTAFLGSEAAPDRLRQASLAGETSESSMSPRRLADSSRADTRAARALHPRPKWKRPARGRTSRLAAEATSPPVAVEAIAPPPLPEPSRLRGTVVKGSGGPVARAQVALRAAVGGRQGGTILARAETDWRGRFVLEEVPPTEEACLEVEADFYLTYRGPSLSIPAGADLELRIVTLHFGGSLSGEVLDGDGVRLPQAEVVLSRRDSIGSGQTVVSRTDSRGTFRLSGLAPGEYAMEVRHDGAIAARFAGMWIEADVPTVQIQLHLDGSPLIFSEEPDAQMFRVYRAERIIAVASRRFESLEEIQAYVDAMVASWWWRSELPRVEAIEVRMAKEETDPARGGPDLLWDGARGAWKAEATGHMELPTWAWSELVVLHEAAHVLSPLDKHGPTFARTLHYLIWRMLGEAAAAELALAYAAEGVQWW